MTQVVERSAPAPAAWGIDRALLPPKAYYFCYYAAMACLMPYLPLHYREIGLSGAQIGLLAGLSPIITWIAAPFWGALADSTRQHRAILTVTMVGSMCMVALLSGATGLLWLLPIVAANAFFMAPMMPLVDNSLMEQLGERRYLYGRQRMWGSIGWGIAAAGAGLLVDYFGLSFSFYAYLLFMALGLVISYRMVVSGGPIGKPFWTSVGILTKNRALLIFLISVLFAGIGSSLVHNYLFLYLADLGASTTLMGLSQTVATFSEVPVFLLSAVLLRKIGARGLLLLSLAAYVVRLLAYAYLMPPVWVVLPIAMLHGLTFSALWVAGVSYANEVAPQGMGATAQGLFTGMSMGLGSALGALLGGALYDNFGPVVLMQTAAMIVLVGLLFFAVAGRSKPVAVQGS
jgi:PPP family 3-phenylpropionic acid transporter